VRWLPHVSNPGSGPHRAARCLTRIGKRKRGLRCPWGQLPKERAIYGTSAGALNGAATAAGQAAMSSTQYQDAALRRVM
jgi:hypothetical protein